MSQDTRPPTRSLTRRWANDAKELLELQHKPDGLKHAINFVNELLQEKNGLVEDHMKYLRMSGCLEWGGATFWRRFFQGADGQALTVLRKDREFVMMDITQHAFYLVNMVYRLSREDDISHETGIQLFWYRLGVCISAEITQEAKLISGTVEKQLCSEHQRLCPAEAISAKLATVTFSGQTGVGFVVIWFSWFRLACQIFEQLPTRCAHSALSELSKMTPADRKRLPPARARQLLLCELLETLRIRPDNIPTLSLCVRVTSILRLALLLFDPSEVLGTLRIGTHLMCLFNWNWCTAAAFLQSPVLFKFFFEAQVHSTIDGERIQEAFEALAYQMFIQDAKVGLTLMVGRVPTLLCFVDFLRSRGQELRENWLSLPRPACVVGKTCQEEQYKIFLKATSTGRIGPPKKCVQVAIRHLDEYYSRPVPVTVTKGRPVVPVTVTKGRPVTVHTIGPAKARQQDVRKADAAGGGVADGERKETENADGTLGLNQQQSEPPPPQNVLDRAVDGGDSRRGQHEHKNKLNRQIKRLNQAIKSLTKDKDELQRECEELTNKIANAKGELRRIKKRVTDSEERLARINEQTQELRQQFLQLGKVVYEPGSNQ